MIGIYLHIPFCAKVCDYCDFHVLPAHERLFQEYADLICREIDHFEVNHPGLLAKAETLYLGGGTPSILPARNIAQLFECLRDKGVEVTKLREVSMEFNPESVSEETVYNAMSCGVNRISLGLQTFDPSLLKAIGRAHTVERGLEALDFLTKISAGAADLPCSLADGGSAGGPLQVSGDLMFDLPGQTVRGFLDDVDRLSDFPLNHISFYGLTVNPRTVLGQKVSKGALSIDEDLYEDMYLGGVELLRKKGFDRYEVSNFAKPGFESVHNRNYWERGEYAGFGPGAHSFLGSNRFYAPEMYPRWRDYVNAGARQSDLTVDSLDSDDMLAELIWLSMRQSRGLDMSELENFGKELPTEKIDKWLSKGYLVWAQAEVCGERHTSLRLAGRGWIFMDDIVTDIMNSCSNLE